MDTQRQPKAAWGSVINTHTHTHSAWAPTGACGRGAGLEENCIKDPRRIKIIQAISVHTTLLERAGYMIVGGKISDRQEVV